jgi:uncharacterized protein
MNRVEKLKELVRHKYDNGDPSHDWAHILRVIKTCESFGKKENANLDTLLPAAILHDLINIPKDSPNRTKASEMAAKASAPYLETSWFTVKKKLMRYHK